jgi:rhodanese-related sulfurtransferase
MLATSLVLFCVQTLSAAEHTKDSLEVVKERVQTKETAVLLDVREQKEWDAGHLSDAKLFPLSRLRAGKGESDFAKEVAKLLPKDKIVYCHCRSGGRVLPATDILKELGYDVRPLKAGYSQLLEAGFPKAPEKP